MAMVTVMLVLKMSPVCNSLDAKLHISVNAVKGHKTAYRPGIRLIASAGRDVAHKLL